ncbi:MAG: GDCCVxC domain-containing (seleno)protein [archaeon]
MAKKRVIKIYKSAKIICPSCGKKSIFEIPEQACAYYFECKKCKQKHNTPPARCCAICAYSNKKCAPSSLEEARRLGIPVRRL